MLLPDGRFATHWTSKSYCLTDGLNTTLLAARRKYFRAGSLLTGLLARANKLTFVVWTNAIACPTFMVVHCFMTF